MSLLTDFIYSAACAISAIALLLGCAALVLWLMRTARDWAADRKREQQFADEWVRAHRARHDHTFYEEKPE